MASRPPGVRGIVNEPSSTRAPEPRPAAIASVFNRHQVRYVVIGAFAAIAQQAPIAPTRDIDFAPENTMENLRNLSSVLDEIDAQIRTDTESAGIPFNHDGTSLRRAEMWNLICRYGEFDLAFRPAGIPGGYRELAARSHLVAVEGVEVRVADLADVIRSKEAAGRPKDVRVLPALYRHQAQRESREPPG